MQLGQANWQLGEVLVRESWLIILEICQKPARRGLEVYRATGGPGFVWAGSFNSNGQGTLRFFAIDPSALLPVSKERTDPQNDCDRLAANPSDRRKPSSVPGVPYDSLMNQAEQAIEVCTLATWQNPAELRYEYQLARAMEAKVPEKAVEIYKKLAGKGYPAAYDNLGSLMVKLYENYGAAITYFKTGSQLHILELHGQSRGIDR